MNKKAAAFRIVGRINNLRWQGLRREYAGSDLWYQQKYHKYFDLPKWVLSYVGIVEAAGLDRETPRRVLDLGCGSGLFAFVLRELGHAPAGVDLSDPMFTAMQRHLGVPVRHEPIVAHQPLPSPEGWERPDWITAIAVTFDRDVERPYVNRGRWWGHDEWAWFFREAAGLLTPGGRLLVKFNVLEHDRTRYFPDEPTERMVRRIGRQLNGKLWLFDREEVLAQLGQ